MSRVISGNDGESSESRLQPAYFGNRNMPAEAGTQNHFLRSLLP